MQYNFIKNFQFNTVMETSLNGSKQYHGASILSVYTQNIIKVNAYLLIVTYFMQIVTEAFI